MTITTIPSADPEKGVERGAISPLKTPQQRRKKGSWFQDPRKRVQFADFWPKIVTLFEPTQGESKLFVFGNLNCTHSSIVKIYWSIGTDTLLLLVVDCYSTSPPPSIKRLPI